MNHESAPEGIPRPSNSTLSSIKTLETGGRRGQGLKHDGCVASALDDIAASEMPTRLFAYDRSPAQ